MKNRTVGLRTHQGGQIVLMQTRFDGDDNLVCSTPLGEILVPPDDQAQVPRLLERLNSQGLEPFGCFNCIYFTQSGMQGDSGGSVGYCLEGKLGRGVEPTKDCTTMESSCDAHTPGSSKEQEACADSWAESIGVKRRS